METIHSDTIGPDGTPLPYDKSLVVPYATPTPNATPMPAFPSTCSEN